MKYFTKSLLLISIFLILKPSGAQTNTDDVESIDSLLLKASTFRFHYNFEKALNLYQESLKKNPSSQEALSGAAFCAYQSGMLNLSENLYQKLLLQDSNNLQALANSASIAMKTKNYHKAKQLYLKTLALDSSNAFFQKQTGLVFEKLGQLSASAMHYQAALNLNNKDTDAALKLANISYKLEQYPDALSTLKSAIGHSSDNITLLRLMLKSYYRIDSSFKVMSTGVKLLSMGDTTNNTLKMTGVSFFNQKIYQSAIEFLSLLPEDQLTPSILYYLGISYRKQLYFEKSKTAFDQAIEKGMPPHFERYFIHKSLTQQALDDFEGAVKTCERGLEITKKDALLFHLARAYDSWYKDKQPAIRYYKKYLQSPEAINLYRNYAETRIKNLRETEHFNAQDSLSID